jgi:hypothetical protein
MMHIPLLSAATATTTNNNTIHKAVTTSRRLLSYNLQQPLQIPHTYITHTLKRPQQLRFCFKKEPWIKVSQTIPLSRIRVTYRGKTHHGKH